MNSKITLFLLEIVLIVFCKMTVSIMYLCENYDRVVILSYKVAKNIKTKNLNIQNLTDIILEVMWLLASFSKSIHNSKFILPLFNLLDVRI